MCSELDDACCVDGDDVRDRSSSNGGRCLCSAANLGVDTGDIGCRGVKYDDAFGKTNGHDPFRGQLRIWIVADWGIPAKPVSVGVGV